MIVEHTLSTAVEQLQLGRTQLWSQFRVAAPSGAGATRLDQLTDLMQLGVLALALLLGRPIRHDEYPVRLQDLLSQAADAERSTTLHTPTRSLRAWILRTLQAFNGEGELLFKMALVGFFVFMMGSFGLSSFWRARLDVWRVSAMDPPY